VVAVSPWFSPRSSSRWRFSAASPASYTRQFALTLGPRPHLGPLEALTRVGDGRSADAAQRSAPRPPSGGFFEAFKTARSGAPTRLGLTVCDGWCSKGLSDQPRRSWAWGYLADDEAFFPAASSRPRTGNTHMTIQIPNAPPWSAPNAVWKKGERCCATPGVDTRISIAGLNLL